MAFRAHLRAITITVVVGCLLGCPTPDDPTSVQGGSLPPHERLLSSGAEVEEWLEDGGSYRYGLSLTRGQVLHVTLEQMALDVRITLEDPHGVTVIERDSPNGIWGPEELWFLANVDSDYWLVVGHGAAQQAGRFRLRAQVITEPEPEDRRRARAARALWEGEQAASAGRPDADVLACYEQALKHWRQTGEVYQEVLVHLRIAAVYASAEHTAAAITSYRQAVTALDALDREDLSVARLALLVLDHLGDSWLRAGQLEQAEQVYGQALELARTMGDQLGEALSLHSLAKTKHARNELRDAVDLFRQALQLLRTMERAEPMTAVLRDLGRTLSLLGKLPEALDVLQEARQLCGSAYSRRLVAILTEIGWVSYLRDEPAEAVTAYQEALQLTRSAGEWRDEAGILDRLGTAYRQLGRWPEALTAYQRALALLQRRGNRRYQAHTLTNISELYEAWGRPQQALEQNDRALTLFEQLPHADSNGQAHALYVRARAEAQLGDLASACRHSEEVLVIVEQLRQQLTSQALSQPFFAMRQIYVDSYLGQLMAAHALRPDAGHDRLALAALERSRARGLLDTFLQRGGPPDRRLLQRRAELQTLINDQEQQRRQRAGAAEPASQDRLARELRELLFQLAEVEAQIRESSGSTGAAPPVPATAEIQELLDDETLLLSFHLGKEQSFLWLVDRHQVRSQVLPPGPEIEDAARSFPELLSRSHLAEGRDQYRLVAERLSRLLLAPVHHDLDRHRLLVIGDGILHALPLSALPDPATGEPLLVKHEIVRAPSAAVLAALRRRSAARPVAGKTMAIIADPVFDTHDSRVDRQPGPARPVPRPAPTGLQRSVQEMGIPDLARLPAARREAESIAALLPEEQRLVALGFAASRELMTSGGLRQYHIIHVASHGLLHPVFPELSGIVLSLVDEQGERRDGFLRCHEIADLDLAADLVVLSACKTALGSQVRGEGVLGLPRSLLHAGATRVVVSLWAVDDSATAELMTRLYRGLLGDGLPPSAALRAAQLSMYQEEAWRDPYYWAGFELQGDWR